MNPAARTPVWPESKRRFHRNGYALALVCAAAVVASGGRAVADEVRDNRGTFSDVTVQGIEKGKLVFRFEDGRVLRRGLNYIRRIDLKTSRPPGGDELSRADTLSESGNFAQAIPVYERARSLATHDWIKWYATFKLLVCCDAQGRFDDVVTHYVELIHGVPEISRDVLPTRYPEKSAPEYAAALQRIDGLIAKSPPRTMAEALERLRRSIVAGKAVTKLADNRPTASSQPASQSAGSHGAGATAALPRDQRATAKVYELLLQGHAGEARALCESALQDRTDAQRDVWWLADAECRLVLNQPELASVAAMKVIAFTPDSAYFGEALFVAGKAYESLRPTKAEALFEDCLRHPTTPDDVRKEAADRLARLRASESGSDSHKDGAGGGSAASGKSGGTTSP